MGPRLPCSLGLGAQLVVCVQPEFRVVSSCLSTAEILYKGMIPSPGASGLIRGSAQPALPEHNASNYFRCFQKSLRPTCLRLNPLSTLEGT